MGLSDVKYYMIGIVLGLVMIFGGMFTLSNFKSVNSNLDVSRMEAFNETFYVAENMTNAVNSMSNSIENAGDKPGPLGWFNVLFGSAWQGLKALSGSLGFVKVIIYNIAEFFGVPPAIAVLIALLPIIIIVFSIWGAIAQIPD